MKADVTELQKIRDQINRSFIKENKEVRLTLTGFIARAVTLALKTYPIMNSTLLNNELHYNKEIHIGIAVSLKSGLIVPVLRNTEKMGIRDLSNAIQALGNRARNSELNLSDIIGSTFSITNLGKTGVEYFTPVLNPPESGILGIGSATQTVQYDSEGTLSKRELLPLSLTFDHRVTDGKPAGEFLARIKYLLENPWNMLI